jgi:hypothetical protein
MSGLYVRNLVRTWLASIGDVPFYDTINKVVKPTENVWVTVEFFVGSKEGTINCGDYLEHGTIDLVFVSKPGIGDGPVLAVLEPFVAKFMDLRDDTARLVIDQTEEVRELSGGDADGSYRMGVGISYAFSFMPA